MTFSVSDNDKLEESIAELFKLLKEKKQNHESELIIAEESIDIINVYINAILKFKTAALKKIADELNAIQGKNIDSIVREIKAKIGIISSVKLNLSTNNIFPPNMKTNSNIAATCGQAELKEYAKYTTQVIEYIDNLHFKKIKGHN